MLSRELKLYRCELYCKLATTHFQADVCRGNEYCGLGSEEIAVALRLLASFSYLTLVNERTHFDNRKIKELKSNRKWIGQQLRKKSFVFSYDSCVFARWVHNLQIFHTKSLPEHNFINLFHMRGINVPMETHGYMVYGLIVGYHELARNFCVIFVSVCI